MPKPKEIRGAKLPPYSVLKRHLFIDVMSYKDIGDKYKCSPNAVYQTVKRRAEAYGDPWPLTSNELKQRKRVKANDRKNSRRFYKSDLIASEIREFLEESGYARQQLAREAGLNKSTVTRLLNGGKWVSKDTITKIMKVITTYEDSTNAA